MGQYLSMASQAAQSYKGSGGGGGDSSGGQFLQALSKSGNSSGGGANQTTTQSGPVPGKNPAQLEAEQALLALQQQNAV